MPCCVRPTYNIYIWIVSGVCSNKQLAHSQTCGIFFLRLYPSFSVSDLQDFFRFYRTFITKLSSFSSPASSRELEPLSSGIEALEVQRWIRFVPLPLVSTLSILLRNTLKLSFPHFVVDLQIYSEIITCFISLY